MLVRRPAPEVFAAFVEPAQVTRYWFSDASGPLAPDAVVEWTWAPYGASATVRVLEFERQRRIVTAWPNVSGETVVEYRFQAQPDGTTWVQVTESGFRSTGMDLVREVADSTQGFTLVLAGLKAWCEHGLQLNLVWDRYPSGLTEE
jgi:uncharacterized protein YndB with AHSA1/START domain